MERVLQAFDDFLEKFSRLGLIFCLYLILGLAVVSICLRWAGHSPQWLEPLIRHLVFLSAFLGGSLATSKGAHIKIDLLTHLLENAKSKVFSWLHRNIITLFCFITTMVLTKSSYDFFSVEKEFGGEAFLGLHSSVLVLIIPVGMCLISVRFMNRLLLGLIQGDARGNHRL
jgi:TRAP-type C4-dicarboxylate transport system permease small subunit